MTIEQLIEKAIAGGWKYLGMNGKHSLALALEDAEKQNFTFLLDPEFWKAVGKVEWDGKFSCPHWESELVGERSFKMVEMPHWKYYMHAMIDALAEGKTIEEFIATL